MTPTKVALISVSRTIKHIASAVCQKYKIELFLNESDVSKCDIILIDDGANGLSYDRYKTTINRVALFVNSGSKSLSATGDSIDEVLFKPFLPSELAVLILKLEAQTNQHYREFVKQKIHHNFLVDSTIIHEQKEKAHSRAIDIDQEQDSLEINNDLEDLKNNDNVNNVFSKQESSMPSKKAKKTPFVPDSEIETVSTTVPKMPMLGIEDEILSQKTKKIDADSLIKELTSGLSESDLLASKQLLDNLRVQASQKEKELSDNPSLKFDFKNTDVKDDESTVKKSDLSKGGILNSDDILQVKKLLGETSGKDELIGQIDTLNVETQPDEWDSISKIVDDSIKEYTFEVEEPLRFVLNAYSIKELEPFFEKLDAKGVESLINGESISLDIKLKDD